jgi:regulator of protease activity HflC (stomatin/prohibitin superfamily)
MAAILLFVGIVLAVVILLALMTGIKTVRQKERGLIERFGKFQRYAEPGINFLIPIVEEMTLVNITERMVNADPQTIITKDKLNAQVDAQVYFKVKNNEESVKASQYNVNDYKLQIVNLARTTLRNIIGTMTLNTANSDRDLINSQLMDTLKKETVNWGLEVVRTELKEIDPPKEVQETMNKVVIAENEKQAAIDFATSVETKADGAKRGAIKEAEGVKQANILEAEGQAQAIETIAKANAKQIELINQSIQKNFVGAAIDYKRLETAATALKNNTKYVIDSESNITNVISEVAGVTPIARSGGNKDGADTHK